MGPLDPAAYAASRSSDNETASEVVLSDRAGPWIVGDNIVAAMVKQSDAASSDTSFDLALEVTSGAKPP